MWATYDSKYKKGKGKGPKYGKRGIKASCSGHKHKRGKHGGKRGQNTNYFNCGKPDLFAHDCSKPNIMFNHTHPSNLYVSSCLMLVESIPFWTIDLGATDHITRDQTTFMEFCQILKGRRYIYMGNNAPASVLGISTYKMDLRGGRTLYLYDVLYAP
jgi:hypothetical protein